MADLSYVRSYPAIDRHQAEMRQALNQRRRRLWMSGLGGLAACALAYWLAPPLAVLVAGIALLVAFFSSITGSSSVPADQMSGAEGEARVLKALHALPDEYVVFNQLMIPDPSLANGRRELDFVVVAPASVFIVEVKNTRGLIYVRPDERQWPLAHKAGCGGRPGWNAIDNPLGQLRGQIDALNRWLLQHGQVRPIQPVLCFPRPDVALNDRDLANMPILTAAELVPYLLDASRGGTARPDEALVGLIARQAGVPGPTVA